MPTCAPKWPCRVCCAAAAPAAAPIAPPITAPSRPPIDCPIIAPAPPPTIAPSTGCEACACGASTTAAATTIVDAANHRSVFGNLLGDDLVVTVPRVLFIFRRPSSASAHRLDREVQPKPPPAPRPVPILQKA